jgi:ribose transport system substrate-binding protein
VAVGQGADLHGREALHRADLPFIGSTGYHPEEYGSDLLALALKILEGKVVPPALYRQHDFITRENIGDYYPRGFANREKATLV